VIPEPKDTVLVPEGSAQLRGCDLLNQVPSILRLNAREMRQTQQPRVQNSTIRRDSINQVGTVRSVRGWVLGINDVLNPAVIPNHHSTDSRAVIILRGQNMYVHVTRGVVPDGHRGPKLVIALVRSPPNINTSIPLTRGDRHLLGGPYDVWFPVGVQTNPPGIDLPLIHQDLNDRASLDLDMEHRAIIRVLPQRRIVSKQSKRDIVRTPPKQPGGVVTAVIQHRKVVLTLSLKTQRNNPRGRGLWVPRPRVGKHGVAKVLHVVVRGSVGLIPEPDERHRRGAGQIKVNPTGTHRRTRVIPRVKLRVRVVRGRGHTRGPQSHVHGTLGVLLLPGKPSFVSRSQRVSPVRERNRLSKKLRPIQSRDLDNPRRTVRANLPHQADELLIPLRTLVRLHPDS